MNVSLDSVSKHSLISRFLSKLAIIGLAAVATFAAALPLSAASDTFTQAAEGYFYCNTKGVNNNSDFPTYFGVGDTVDFSGIYGTERRFGYLVNTDLQAGCTYTVTFKISYENIPLLSRFDDVTFVGLTFNDHLPSWVDILDQYNSDGVNYNSFLEWSYVANSDDNYDLLTFAFCTAQGYIDNLEWGELYAAFDFLGELTVLGKPVIDGIYVDCVVDPSAEYFQNLSLNNFKNFNNELKQKLGLLSAKESEILEQTKEYYDKSHDLLGSSIDAASSFISPLTRGAGSIASAVGVFTSAIYDPIMSSLPADLGILFTVIPTLAFAAWFIGFGKGF